MRNDVNARPLDAQQLFHLRGGMLGHGNNRVAARGRVAGLLREARAEFGRGIVAGHDEQVVEGGDGLRRRDVHPLVKSVKQFRARSAKQQTPPDVRGHRLSKRAQETVRPVIVEEAVAGVRARQPEHEFQRVHADAGKIASHAIGGIQPEDARS